MSVPWGPSRYDCGGCKACVRASRGTPLARVDHHIAVADRRLVIGVAVAVASAIVAVLAAVLTWAG